jgi:RNA polymerase sigma-70 factor, ECF subfamily
VPLLQPVADFSKQLEQLYQQHSRQVLATLIRLLGDFDRAEDALQEAFSVALAQWPQSGIPESPVAWLISTGRFKAIDKMRRQRRFVADGDAMLAQFVDEQAEGFEMQQDSQLWSDDYLRLVFTCCHPALSIEAQLALTLREVCGLTTEQIARAFLQSTSTIAQRIVRAKQKIKAATIPYQVPASDQLAPRLQAVHKVIYLLFNEGYSADLIQPSADEALPKIDLAQQAIDMAKQLLALQFDTESCGLLALLLLQHARQAARFTTAGQLILLPEQDRSRWDQALIAEGVSKVETALSSGRIGPYSLQAAIAAIHNESPDSASTDWPQIHALYQLLYRVEPTPVVALNQLVAMSMCEGPAAALLQLPPLLQDATLAQYHLLYAVAADFHRQLGHHDEAIDFYRQALKLATSSADQQFLQQRLCALSEVKNAEHNAL